MPETAKAYANSGFREKSCSILGATKNLVLFFAQAMVFAKNWKKCFGWFSSIGGEQHERLLSHDRRNNVSQTMYNIRVLMIHQVDGQTTVAMLSFCSIRRPWLLASEQISFSVRKETVKICLLSRISTNPFVCLSNAVVCRLYLQSTRKDASRLQIQLF